jgi:hypothetical protein
MRPAAGEVVRIARKLDAVAALASLAVSLAATCPCIPAAPARDAQAAADGHACCRGAASPTLVAAREGCCDGHALADRAAAAPSSPGASLGADAGVVRAGSGPARTARPRPSWPGFVSRPPSVLRI